MSKILVLPGDGIGVEITKQAIKVIQKLNQNSLGIELIEGLIGGDAYDKTGHPLPPETIDSAKNSDSILLGAVGGYKWEKLERDLRPERGLLGIRAELDLFSNLRPAILYPQLADASTLKPEIVSGLDLMIVRELVGGIYFGEPRGIEIKNGEKFGFNTACYSEREIERIAHSAFKIAEKRDKKLCSVDKANVLEVCELWREVMESVAKDYPSVELSHMYVDNAAMQLVRTPKQFDVMVTTNMFGDILSDEASVLAGSMGLLASSSVGEKYGVFEPIHGSAPDIAGQGIANPYASILSIAMMLHWLNLNEEATAIENAVSKVIDQGVLTKDLDPKSEVTTKQAIDAVVNNI